MVARKGSGKRVNCTHRHVDTTASLGDGSSVLGPLILSSFGGKIRRCERHIQVNRAHRHLKHLYECKPD